MNNSAKRYIRYYHAPVLAAAVILLSFCFFKSIVFLLAILLLCFVLYRVHRARQLQLHVVDLAVVGVLLTSLAISLFNAPGLYVKASLFNLLFNLLVYFAIRISLRKELQEQLFMGVLACFALFLSFLGLVSFLFFRFSVEYEGFSNLVNFKSMYSPLGFLLNDWVAILLLSFVFLLLPLSQVRFKQVRWKIYMAGVLLCSFGLLSSFSRGAYLSILFGGLVFFLFSTFSRSIPLRKMALFFGGVCLVFFIIAFPIRNEVITTAGLSTTSSQARSISGRLALWNTSFKLVQDYPLLGVGHGKLSLYAHPYLAEQEDASFTGRATNSYLQLLAEQGIVGFIPWAVLVCLLLWSLLQQVRSRNRYALQALIALSVLGAVLFREISFSTFFELPQFQLLFFVLAAWIVNHDKSRISFVFPQFVVTGVLSILFLVLSVYQLAYYYSEKKNNAFIKACQEEKYAKALTEIDKALKLEKNSPLLYANKANLLVLMASNDSSKKNIKAEALRLYETAVQCAPVDPYLNHNLAWLYQEAGLTDSAHCSMQKAADLSKNSALFQFGMHELTINGEDDTRDLQYLENAVRLSPGFLDSEYLRCFENRYTETYRRILKKTSDCLMTNLSENNSPILKSRLGKIQLHLGDTISAVKLWEEATHQLPNLDRPWYNRSMIQLARKDTMAFKTYLNRAIFLDPRDYLYAIAYGNFYYEQGENRDAAYYYQLALSRYHNRHTGHSLIASKWYGYKALPNNLLPLNRLEIINPSIDKTKIVNRLIILYEQLERNLEKEVLIKYRNGEISFNKLIFNLKYLSTKKTYKNDL